MIKNTQSINLIEGDKRISLYCPIGEDYYTADIHFKFVPDQYYMDYIDLDKFICGLSGKNLTIEDAAETVHEELQKYSPLKSCVTIEADSNTHLHVTVAKGDNI